MKWCMWPTDDTGNVCMRPVVAVATMDPGMILCPVHANRVESVPLCICGCDCSRAATKGKELCWPCWSSIRDVGAVRHLDREEAARA